jgi:uncharacterized protein YyaL (SSP411 family)
VETGRSPLPEENKPLLISGYRATGAMDGKESFMDTGIARIMNENFVCIKVIGKKGPTVNLSCMPAN